MRPIKFRVWSNELSKMIYPDEKGWFQNCFIGSNQFYQTCSLGVALDKNGKELELMQYTGLKDKNGREVFESDIVSRHEGGIHFTEESISEHVVEWGNYGWHPFEVGEGKYRCVYGDLYDFIVIGNIYENPELVQS